MLDRKQKLAYIAKNKNKQPGPKPKAPLEEMTDFELDKEFKRRKIVNINVRTMGYQMDLARIRDKLIDKELVIKQLQFLLIAFRQKVLTIPMTYARKLQRKDDLKEIHSILQAMCHQLLTELVDLPIKSVDPDWLKQLDEEE